MSRTQPSAAARSPAPATPRPSPQPAPDPEPYRVTAEFYDLLHRSRYRRKAQRELAALARSARAGILEVGAGTGIVTEVLAESTSVPVHAVEPARAMRTVLLSRWAGSSPMRRHVRVYPQPVQELRPVDPVDLMVCVNLVDGLAPPTRRLLWSRARALLRPGGLLVVDRTGAVPRRPKPLSAVVVGDTRYEVTVVAAPVEGSRRLRWTFRYTVTTAEGAVREEQESFDLWPVEEAEVRAEVASAGLAAGPPQPGLLVFRR
ncbi:SAM-dependent methyltransferase [Actinoalloteichus hoggarensis]|uniref:Methyltransferase domain protein n=1 Tax=Actinoalloteichus hoggarensis TaxID=1470176 RepID=A0A221W3R8_9PSEU|nr:class I SAM-dependent methyltransferase [Actinoalloteichus hoggarensis]ASO20404.1 Methyltransferase domain protein [Actinoalloteichus hoggarensis]MBB5923443.1 SAM-dependent methyltransferase [Actinoalloteichus hoggarensis]